MFPSVQPCRPVTKLQKPSRRLLGHRRRCRVVDTRFVYLHVFIMRIARVPVVLSRFVDRSRSWGMRALSAIMVINEKRNLIVHLHRRFIHSGRVNDRISLNFALSRRHVGFVDASNSNRSLNDYLVFVLVIFIKWGHWIYYWLLFLATLFCFTKNIVLKIVYCVLKKINWMYLIF